ncbi:hypothetical protein BT63DRAFT_477028 [Microthyrium microscopicum]|uniref:Nudix hydrolase domain-containing protein n=1 Tax=Microthyrium microscopicum TaxID=703497 RepID=A0A6A6UMV5_9PEZI|nr:hypothetical protein BT63DRAFT_477028 [Microthyrium microscopicum]
MPRPNDLQISTTSSTIRTSPSSPSLRGSPSTSSLRKSPSTVDILAASFDPPRTPTADIYKNFMAPIPEEDNTPKIMISVFAIRADGTFLLGSPISRDDPFKCYSWGLPCLPLEFGDTFEHCALRIARMHCLKPVKPKAAYLDTMETVPTDHLPNGGKHTVMIFMALWVEDGSSPPVQTRSGTSILWNWVRWEELSIKCEAKSPYKDLCEPLRQLKWTHYTERFHPLKMLSEKIVLPPRTKAEKKSAKTAKITAEKSAKEAEKVAKTANKTTEKEPKVEKKKSSCVVM